MRLLGTGLSSSRLRDTLPLPLWVFNCINWELFARHPASVLPATAVSSHPVPKGYKRKGQTLPPQKGQVGPSPPSSLPPTAQHFPGPQGSDRRTALPVPGVPGSTATHSPFP